MPYPGLEHYLERLYGNTQANTKVWLDADGRAQGRYFNSTLTSAFQPIRDIDTERLIGFEGFARSYSDTDEGLSLWKLLDHAANDDESVELDRLCRMLHAINFFRQPASSVGELYLSVHARLLAAVEGNHGTAFSRVLKVLDLPKERVVLQLPAIVEHQGWLVNYVADNYRRNGFRIAVNASDVDDAFNLLERVRPDVVKLDARQVVHDISAAQLATRCRERGVRLIFKRVESRDILALLARVRERAGTPVYGQGFLWGMPQASLFSPAPCATATGLQTDTRSSADV